MRRFLCVLLLTVLVESTAWATWSIVAVDRNTGRVVIASATCAASTTPDRLKVLQAVVVPGKGVAACQAGVDPTHRNHMVVFDGLQNGTHPSEIIRMLESDPDIERRQFGIVDLQGRSAGRSGSSNGQISLDVQGEVPAANIFYSVQGNSIARPAAMIEAARVLAETPGPITDRVMAAMEKADSLGGDRRCTCDREPLADAPCSGKTAHVAYILAADPDNALGTHVGNPPEDRIQPWNDGDYALFITVIPTTTEPHEDGNPVRTLRMRYDEWKAENPSAIR